MVRHEQCSQVATRAEAMITQAGQSGSNKKERTQIHGTSAVLISNEPCIRPGNSGRLLLKELIGAAWSNKRGRIGSQPRQSAFGNCEKRKRTYLIRNDIVPNCSSSRRPDWMPQHLEHGPLGAIPQQQTVALFA